jgi:hypothetical protein
VSVCRIYSKVGFFGENIVQISIFLAAALGILLSTYKWTQFAIISDTFILNDYVQGTIQYYVAAGLFGECVSHLTNENFHFQNKTWKLRTPGNSEKPTI